MAITKLSAKSTNHLIRVATAAAAARPASAAPVLVLLVLLVPTNGQYLRCGGFNSVLGRRGGKGKRGQLRQGSRLTSYP